MAEYTCTVRKAGSKLLYEIKRDGVVIQTRRSQNRYAFAVGCIGADGEHVFPSFSRTHKPVGAALPANPYVRVSICVPVTEA